MIHIVKEAGRLYLGLNIGAYAHGFSLIWLWFNPCTYKITARRFRFRYHMYPYFLTHTEISDASDNALLMRGQVAIRREVAEDRGLLNKGKLA